MIGSGCGGRRLATLLLLVISCVGSQTSFARSRVAPAPAATAPAPSKRAVRQDDSLSSIPAKDLQLRLESEHKADALARFVEGMAFEETGEMDKALASYRRVLDVDPGQTELA